MSKQYTVWLSKDPDALAAVGIDEVPGRTIVLVNVNKQLRDYLRDAGVALHVEKQDAEIVLDPSSGSSSWPGRRVEQDHDNVIPLHRSDPIHRPGA